MSGAKFEDLNLDHIISGLYERPSHRHAVQVTSDDDVERVRLLVEAGVSRLQGAEAILGRGIRLAVEREDDGRPFRVWLWRALVGGQRVAREGFSGIQRATRA